MDAYPKVELHVHFDGACDIELLKDLCRADGLDKDRFPYDDHEKFRRVVSLVEPQESLVDFLKPFPEVNYILSSKNNLKLHSIDFCRRQSENNVIYSEVRFCPMFCTDRGLTRDDVISSIIEGLKEGEKKYGIKVRMLFAFLRGFPEWSIDIAKLAIKHKKDGVLGVDIAGDELQPMDQRHIEAFQLAHDNGLHVTVHAAESGPASNVTEAITKLHATRIGHGYHVLDDSDVYQLAREKGVHFETCLTSSIYTNSADYENHTMKRFAQDKVNFGLNTDDPGIIGCSMNGEFRSAGSDLNLTKDQLIETIYNSARSCFLPEDEKQALIEEIDKRIQQLK